MASSKSTDVNLQSMQSISLIWLDSSVGDDTEDVRDTIAQLRRVINDVSTFTDGEQCIHFIRTVDRLNKICLVISGALGQHVVPHVHDMHQVDAILIFCSNKERHEFWAKDWAKIIGVFTEISPIRAALRQVAQLCEHNAVPMSFMPSDAQIDRLEPSFAYTRIWKEILLTIDFNDQHVHDYAKYCRDALSANPKELKYIEQLEQHYHEKTPIWWYSCKCFLCPMLNRALRTLDADIMVRMGFFLNDLHRHIEQVHREQNASQPSTTTFSVYRGQGLSLIDFKQLRKTEGELMSFNCFLSTDKRRAVSLEFAQRAISNPDLVGVLFEMEIDPVQTTIPFASTHDLSATEGEDEVLFAMHAVFRVNEVKVMDGNSRLYEVRMSMTNDNDPELRALTNRIREESFPESKGWYGLAVVTKEMGQLDKAEQIFETLLGQETDDRSKASLFTELGTIRHNRGDYEEATKFYEKAMAIQQQSQSGTRADLASSYMGIGNVHYSTGDFTKALASYENALGIRQQLFTPTHPDLALPYTGIANVYNALGNYPEALASYEKALVIQQKSLSRTHPALAATHNNVGVVYHCMGDYAKALASYEKALKIRQQSLSPTHPDLASSYTGIANGYSSMGDFAKALASYEEALAIQHQALPPTHPHLAVSYSNIGHVYHSMRDYPKALASHENARRIRRQSLFPTHPDLALSHMGIANVYYSTDDFPKALRSYEKALKIQEQSLPPTHPHLASSYHNIGNVQHRMGDFPKALASYEKALEIRQQSLSPTHPDLALSYVGIAHVYDALDDVTKAFDWYEKALAIQEQSLPPAHPDLEATYNCMRLLDEKMETSAKPHSSSEYVAETAPQSPSVDRRRRQLVRKKLGNLKKKL